MRQVFLLFALVLFAHSAFSAIEALDFETPQQEQLYNKLTKELRCLVCQNQDIADSNAELAADLRHKTFKLIKQGKKEDEIKQWMVDRYGDFVLYQPPVKTETLLLWSGPLILFLIAIIVVFKVTRGRKNGNNIIDEKQKQQMEALLNQSGEKK